MGHPNPRFLAVARRAAPAPVEPPAAKRREIGMGWKLAALAAGVGVLFWTLSSPKGNTERDGGGDDGDGGGDSGDGGDARRPAKALPPGQEAASTSPGDPSLETAAKAEGAR